MKSKHEYYYEPWLNLLMVYFMGRCVGFHFLEGKFHNVWERDGQIKVINIIDDYYVVTFNHEFDYKFTFQEGPSIITN